MVRTEFVPKVVVNPYGFARNCTVCTVLSRTQKAEKLVWLVHVILWLSGSMLVFGAKCSRFEDSSGRWFLYLCFAMTSL